MAKTLTEKPPESTLDAANDAATSPDRAPAVAKSAEDVRREERDKKREEKRAIFKALKFQGAVCPRRVNHAAKVYKTEGRKRYCKCDDCGETWTQMGDFADPLKQLCADLVKILERSEPAVVEPGQPPVILLEEADARGLVTQLRDLLAL